MTVHKQYSTAEFIPRLNYRVPWTRANFILTTLFLAGSTFESAKSTVEEMAKENPSWNMDEERSYIEWRLLADKVQSSI